MLDSECTATDLPSLPVYEDTWLRMFQAYQGL